MQNTNNPNKLFEVALHLLYRDHAMKCPECNRKAIGFYNWGQGTNAFATICQHCNAELKCSKGIIWGAIATLVFSGLVISTFFIMAPEDTNFDKYRIIVVPIPIFIGAYLTFKMGSYQTKNKPSPILPNTPPPQFPIEASSMKKRGVLFICIALLTIFFMTWLKAYSGIVQFLGEETIATVVNYSQAPSESTRGGDWRMSYEFTSADGKLITGEKIFAPKARPENGVQNITILYLANNPTISDVKGYTSLTGMAGYIMAIFALYSGIQFLRASKALSADASEE